MADGDTVWIVGMMGVGKSTVAELLARRLGRPWVDTDTLVETKTGRTVAEIFAVEGEASFRRLEREAIDSVAGSPVVAALGGGAIAEPGIAARLAASGVVVALHARAETLLARIGNPESRPLLADLDDTQRLERIGSLLAERTSHYESARYRIDTDGLAPEQVTERILQVLASEESAAS